MAAIKSLTEYREVLKRSGMREDDELFCLLTSTYETVTLAADIVKNGARGLTPDAEADLIRRIVGTVNTLVADDMKRRKVRLHRKLVLVAGAAFAGFFCAGWLGGYWWGYSTGLRDAAVTGERVAVAFSHGPEAARVWSELMLYNNPQETISTCSRKTMKLVYGSRQCNVWLWLDAPPAPEGATPAKR